MGDSIRSFFLRAYARIDEESAKNHLVFQVLIVIQAVTCLILLVLRALAGDFVGSFFTDAVWFYAISIVVYVVGMFFGFRRSLKYRSWFLIAYILVVLVLLIGASVGLGRAFSNMTIYQRQCDFAGTNCSHIVDPLVQSVIRNSVMAAVLALAVHPSVSYIMTQRINDKLSTLSAIGPRGAGMPVRSTPVSRGSRGVASTRSLR